MRTLNTVVWEFRLLGLCLFRLERHTRINLESIKTLDSSYHDPLDDPYNHSFGGRRVD